MTLTPIPDILEELRNGKVIVLVDDEARENEGDFVCCAECVTPEIINFMTRIGGGYLCVALEDKTCDRLGLSPQAPYNSAPMGTPFTVTVDGHPRHGIGTGVSSTDRSKTIQLLVDPGSTAEDFVRPGHINPLRARKGGVLVRTGQTEGSIDLAVLAGMKPGAVIIEVVREDGEMARMPELEEICRQHDLKMCSLEQVITYRLSRECLVSRLDPVAGIPVVTPEGEFTLIAFRSEIDPVPHMALTVGGIGDLDENGDVIPCPEPVLVRMHRRDLLGDIFLEESHPTGIELRRSLAMIQEEGRGALVYLRPEGAGGGLRSALQKIRRPGTDNVNTPDLTRDDGLASRVRPMENREHGLGGQILMNLGISRLRILTNHPKTVRGLQGFGLEIVEQVPIK